METDFYTDFYNESIVIFSHYLFLFFNIIGDVTTINFFVNLSKILHVFLFELFKAVNIRRENIFCDAGHSNRRNKAGKF